MLAVSFRYSLHLTLVLGNVNCVPPRSVRWGRDCLVWRCFILIVGLTSGADLAPCPLRSRWRARRSVGIVAISQCRAGGDARALGSSNPGGMAIYIPVGIVFNRFYDPQ
ncbi:hypothetical protein NDU88_002790 [Pleurodeles waltl]|uniref:Uncharacterized protein n=1 Tax=Pleurodeles waltl TaxID=8319 RepID=A0AAV7UZL0_PLEWA|nr:hypothetical protein NDU88_002790 [Pleurodeles waltl]